jgi:hypothetical protein
VIALVVASVLVAEAAVAQSWETKTELKKDSRSTCPKATLIYEFTMAGSQLSGRPCGCSCSYGEALTGAIAADGKVGLHNRSPALGQVIISDNAHAKELQATSSNYPGCVYAFVG